MREDPSARGRFPIFGTVGKMVNPPTETRAKTLRTVGSYCSHRPTKAGGWGFAFLMASYPVLISFFLTHCD